MRKFLFHSGGTAKPIATIVAYVDESGTHKGSKLLCVAAYIGTSDEWESAERRFKRADKHAGVPFHAVDCAQGGKGFHGMDKGKRFRFYQKIVKTIDDHDLFGVASSAWLDDYEQVFPRRTDQRWEDWLVSLFTLVFQVTLADIATYVSRAFPKERFSMAVEDSEHWYAPAAKKFLKMKHDHSWANHGLLETIAPYSKQQAVQLYAPDALAYECYLWKQREQFPTKHAVREHMRVLLRKPKMGNELNKKTFEAIRLKLAEGRAKFDVHLADISMRELSRLNKRPLPM